MKSRRTTLPSASMKTKTELLKASCLCTVIMCSLFAASTSRAESAEDSGTTVEITDSKPLPKAGAAQLRVTFEETKDETYTKKAWIKGFNGEREIWKKPLPLIEGVNVAKTDVVCRKGQIVVLSQFPGSAAYINQTFSWDGKVAKLVSHMQGDPSQKIVDTLTKLSKSGTRDQLDDYCNQDNALFYPGNYVTTKTIEDMLAGGHKVALALNQAHKPALAAQRMEICFDSTAYLVSLVDGGANATAAPANWIEQWTSESMGLAPATWAPLLNDYAFFLQESGKHKQAINVLHAVIKAQPERAVAYLNLGDSLWTADRHSAIKMYQKYKELIVAQDPSTKVPERVATRMGPASASH